MRVAIILAVVFGVFVGLLWQRPRTAPALNTQHAEPPDEHESRPTSDELKADFMSLEETRAQVADLREFVRTFSTLAPYEAARCQLLINEIDALTIKLQSKVLRGESISEELEHLNLLIHQFNQAGAEFKQAGRRSAD